MWLNLHSIRHTPISLRSYNQKKTFKTAIEVSWACESFRVAGLTNNKNLRVVSGMNIEQAIAIACILPNVSWSAIT